MTTTSIVLWPTKIVLDAAIDPDAVLEMDDEVAELERSDRLERRAAGDVPASAANAPLAAKDLVVGENAQPARVRAARRDHEASVEHADRQRRRRRAR